MGLTDVQMLGLIQGSLPDAETAPVEHEVHAVIGLYWFAFLKTNRNGVWHRFLCWVGDREARTLATDLAQARANAKEVLTKSAEHRAVLEQIVRAQPSDLAKQDSLLSLLGGSLKS